MLIPSVALVLQQWEGAVFVRSGLTQLLKVAGRNVFRYANADGYFWAASSSTTATAYSLYFVASTITPSSGTGARFYGFSLRCLSTTAVGR